MDCVYVGFFCVQLMAQAHAWIHHAHTTATTNTTTTTNTIVGCVDDGKSWTPTYVWKDKHGTTCAGLVETEICADGRILEFDTDTFEKDVEGLENRRPAHQACCACGKGKAGADLTERVKNK